MSSSVSGFQPHSKLKKKYLKPKHQKAKVFRASEPLLSVLMWGINYTINELTHVNIPVMLMPDDFKAYTKVKVDNHLFNKENMPSHFKVKEYCPLVFRKLRERFGIDDMDFMNSLTKSQPISVGESPGRSQAKFYQSCDNFLVLKTLHSEEVEQMHSLLKAYHPYVIERHGKTLLPQYLGMYRLSVEGNETYIVVMRNIFSSSIPIHRKYDIKGSTVDREASDKEKEKELPTLKDNDFVKDGIRLYLSPSEKEKLMEMLEADCEFLSKMNLMDYSLCLGIHDCKKYEQEAMDMECMVGTAYSEEDEGESSGGQPVPGSPNNGEVNVVPTPPDSPHLQHKMSNASDHDVYVQSVRGSLDPAKDIYAIESSPECPGKEVYFVGLVDVLTQYGLRKRTAQAAKTVKHGVAAEISTVHPDQYGKRLCEFILKAIA
ncbi:phosphatidylinositol 5-phosphate 4-kinase type-2 alpha-like protein [Dinothrombium tinctorium]|uniref:1-phosphatidylinositol-5-phosphate 4-kinase n=1 Tax=Dinothrombium tinctorium TaxID=1965070 RepID=A0A443RQ44_9ACAR|nr:phosphatidylinositol 5-phosphate 4-kinase type-2 alpha-like protein [Dinothrombium tinctorium]